MNRYSGLWARCLAVPVTAALGAGMVLVAPVNAAASSTPAAQIAVPADTPAPLQPLVAALIPAAHSAGLRQLPAGLTANNWRTQLAPLIARGASAHPHRSVGGSAQGALVAGTVSLPDRFELTGDTTIVAEQIVLSSRTVRVTGGHTLHLYPVNGLSPDPNTAGRSNGPITFDVRGTPGTPGTIGANGTAGRNGAAGANGQAGRNSFWDSSQTFCFGPGDGTDGGDGGDGDWGTDASLGGDGGPGTDLTLDIPAGSTESYTLIADGGTGGQGGQGGHGGRGGPGGFGGRGGSSSSSDCGPGGNGGNGGNGGSGGHGGQGGSGGSGGPGGTITVTYPDGYDPARIQATANGGPGGTPGTGGGGGSAGSPGNGGAGGGGIEWDGLDGWPGFEGLDGNPGSDGSAGNQGGAGTIDMCSYPTSQQPAPPQPPTPTAGNPGDDGDVVEFVFDCTLAAAGASTQIGPGGVAIAARPPGIRCTKKATQPEYVTEDDGRKTVVGVMEVSCEYVTGGPANMLVIGLSGALWRISPFPAPGEPWVRVTTARTDVDVATPDFELVVDADCEDVGEVFDFELTGGFALVPPPGYKPVAKFGVRYSKPANILCS